MKSFLLTIVFFCYAAFAQCQSVTAVPSGKYETRFKAAQNRWEKGDIMILDDSHYKLSNDSETGEYRFSVAAQRIFFMSGPLKNAYTKVTSSNSRTVIIFPVEQNRDLGLKGEVWASQ